MNFTLNIKTDNQTQLIDMTSQIRKIVRESGVKDGICIVFIPHTTAAVTINENADKDVQMDILKEINKVIPFNDGYRHMEGNSAAHIKASLFGFSDQIIIQNGDLLLGTWQGVYFCEFDGPRNRKAYVKIMADR
ncbi:MAG TPA: secondary thiamine-phosphate synthase enzyme YjbQ [Pseudobacteroides sp.]|uniref:secondary thiamine-phosphate synthase enzyme YjbQ n=1 Tax=Pseudobacteroides sp. TaxID=1968840 RepID=UPI002F93246D